MTLLSVNLTVGIALGHSPRSLVTQVRQRRTCAIPLAGMRLGPHL